MSIFDYGFKGSIYEMIAHAGPVGKAVLLILMLFSIISWAIIIKKFKILRQARRETEKFYEIYSKKGNLANIYAVGKNLKNSPVAKLFIAGYNELVTSAKASAPDGQSPEGKKVVIESLDRINRMLSQITLQEITRLEKSLTFLATTGSTTPFIGLFGTVWGVMTAFQGIGAKGSASISVVAPGISEALIATAAGLAAAVPAVIFYNHFVNRVRVATNEMDNFTLDFLLLIEKNFMKK
ncbi:MAG: protein TolQ [Nitrospinae bacterium]|nr:protein TolQ [Nitrospinota bacterium]